MAKTKGFGANPRGKAKESTKVPKARATKEKTGTKSRQKPRP